MAKYIDTNSTKSNDNSFLGDLAELEAMLETPLVPGELEAWIEAVHAATENVGGRLTEQVRTIHEQQFDDIAKQDDELFGRIQQLKEEDAQLLSDFDTFSRVVDRLHMTIVTSDRNETELNQAHAKLVELGLSFVVRARTQEKAIETWYSEAFLRDRGVGD